MLIPVPSAPREHDVVTSAHYYTILECFFFLLSTALLVAPLVAALTLPGALTLPDALRPAPAVAALLNTSGSEDPHRGP